MVLILLLISCFTLLVDFCSLWLRHSSNTGHAHSLLCSRRFSSSVAELTLVLEELQTSFWWQVTLDPQSLCSQVSLPFTDLFFAVCSCTTSAVSMALNLLASYRRIYSALMNSVSYSPLSSLSSQQGKQTTSRSSLRRWFAPQFPEQASAMESPLDLCAYSLFDRLFTLHL